MYQALLKKELRESAGLLAVAALAAVYFLASLSGTKLLPWQTSGVHTIPFVSDNLHFYLWLVCGAMAVLLGLKQTAWEVGWGTYYFLFHRPIARWKLFALKLVVGTMVVWGLAGAMIFTYASWAARPGSHDTPFYWSMTSGAWQLWASLPLLYLGAFLSGIRPARWFGTKLAPLAVAIVATLSAAYGPYWWLLLPVGAVCVATFLPAIFYYVEHRDY